MNKTNSLLLLFVFVFSSCNLAPEYEIPYTETPEQWKKESAVVSPLMACTSEIDKWWEIFEDCRLNELENELLENNKELEKSLLKVFEARASAREKEAQLYPTLTVFPLYSSTGFLTRIFGIPGAPSYLRIHELIYALPLNLFYEMDLWGKLRNEYCAGVMTAESKEFAYQASYLVLTAELASDYFQLRALDAQVEILSNILQLRRDFFAIAQERRRAGWVNELDQTRAQTLLYQAENALSEASRERALLENSIAVLIGKPPSLFQLVSNPLYKEPPSIPSGIPATVLLQRPDIKQAERQVAAANAEVGVKRANFFPSLFLTGLWGFESPELKKFFKWNSRFWSQDVLVQETLFDGGELEAILEQSWSKFRQATTDYQQQVLVSFKEVEDALANLEFLSEETISLTKAEKSAQATAEITLCLYKNGQINYLDVADSARENMQQKQKSIENLSKRYTATIQLIKALGGGWRFEAGAV